MSRQTEGFCEENPFIRAENIDHRKTNYVDFRIYSSLLHRNRKHLEQYDHMSVLAKYFPHIPCYKIA